MIMNRNRFHLDTTPFIEDTYVYPRRWSKRVIMYAKAIVGSSLRLWWSSERDIRINRLCWLIDLKLKINVHDDENECGYESRLVSSWVGEYGKTRSSAVQGRVNEWGLEWRLNKECLTLTKRRVSSYDWQIEKLFILHSTESSFPRISIYEYIKSFILFINRFKLSTICCCCYSVIVLVVCCLHAASLNFYR